MATNPKEFRPFSGPDGTNWGVEVIVPGSSNAIIVFHHPNGRSARLDRYGWYLSNGPEAHNVTARLDPAQVLQSLTDRDVARHFRRSVPIQAERGMVGLNVGEAF
jgi:hypothetical protein